MPLHALPWLALTLLVGPETPDEPVAPTISTAEAVVSLHESLGDDSRIRLVRPFDDPARTIWNFLPGDRVGLPLRDMTPDQRARVRALLDSALSDRGMDAIDGLYSMERSLYWAARNKHYVDPSRDPDHYHVATFGTPDPGATPWGWRMEGHHLSLNLTHVGDETSVTPFFLGVAPFEITDGEDAGTCILRDERDRALELFASLTPEQRETVVISDNPPRDVLLTPGNEERLETFSGIPLADLTPTQQARAVALLALYAGRLREDLAKAEIRRATDAGIDRIHFAWAGGDSADQGHYWRLHGPTFVLEYDCVGGDPDHVHMAWHDPVRNFGADPIARHRAQHHLPTQGN